MSLTKVGPQGWLLSVRIDVKSRSEDFFNEWYTTEHVPDIVNVPGINYGHRYRIIQDETFMPGREEQTYLAIYGVSDLESLRSKEFRKASGADLPNRGWHPQIAADLFNKRISVYESLGGWIG